MHTSALDSYLICRGLSCAAFAMGVDPISHSPPKRTASPPPCAWPAPHFWLSQMLPLPIERLLTLRRGRTRGDRRPAGKRQTFPLSHHSPPAALLLSPPASSPYSCSLPLLALPSTA